MDFDEFEKQEEKKAPPQVPIRTGFATPTRSVGDGNGILDQMEEWELQEAYMYGGGRISRAFTR